MKILVSDTVTYVRFFEVDIDPENHPGLSEDDLRDLAIDQVDETGTEFLLCEYQDDNTPYEVVHEDDLAPHVAAEVSTAREEKAERDELEPIYQAFRSEAGLRSGCEVDEDATVSLSEDGGTYVQAWVWVDDEAAGVDYEGDDKRVVSGGE